MRIVLNYWNRHWQSVSFDPAQGNARVRWLARRPTHCPGFASYQNGRWFTLRLDKQNLMFQAGRDKWPMDDGFTCQNVRRGATRIFTVRRGEEIVLEVKYAVVPQEDDPLGDQLDVESADFFYWVASVWSDAGWRSNLKTAWSQTSLTPSKGRAGASDS